MTKVLVTRGSLEDTAGAIRTKLGVQTTYKPSQFAAAIGSISTQANLGTKTITQNDTYSATDDNLDGYSSVVVNVSGGGGAKNILSGTSAPTANDGSNGDIYLQTLDLSLNEVLLHFDGNITDSYGNTTWSSSGNASISNEQSKFGNSSLCLNNGYIYTISDVVTKLQNNDFTIDFWIYTTSSQRQALFCIGTDKRFDMQLYSQKITGSVSSNGTSWNVRDVDSATKGTTTIQTNTWNHIAYTRSNGVFRMFVNGNIEIEFSSQESIYYSQGESFRIGLYGNNSIPFYGYIDEFHLINGIAMWTSSFTPPINPHTYVNKNMIISTYLKVNGSWVPLIGQDIDDVNTGSV